MGTRREGRRFEKKGKEEWREGGVSGWGMGGSAAGGGRIVREREEKLERIANGTV